MNNFWHSIRIALPGIFALACFVISEACPKDSKRRFISLLAHISFVAAILIQIYVIWASVGTDRELRRIKSLTDPNSLSVLSLNGWREIKLTTGEYTGEYIASIEIKESIPGKPIGRISVSAIAENFCNLRMGLGGVDNVVKEKASEKTMIKKSFSIGRPPFIIKIANKCPSKITIIGSHGIGTFSFTLNDNLPSQLSPKLLEYEVFGEGNDIR